MNLKGIMLVELLIAIAVLAVIAGAVSLNLFGFGRRQDLDSDVKSIVAFLRDAQARAITQEEDASWGAYFDNSVSPPFYALFRGTTYTTPAAMKTLKQAIEFKNPSPGVSIEVVFRKLSGCVLEPPQFTQCRSASIQIVIGIIGSSETKLITINSNGAITY